MPSADSPYHATGFLPYQAIYSYYQLLVRSISLY